jgi:hypothetical protein
LQGQRLALRHEHRSIEHLIRVQRVRQLDNSVRLYHNDYWRASTGQLQGQRLALRHEHRSIELLINVDRVVRVKQLGMDSKRS